LLLALLAAGVVPAGAAEVTRGGEIPAPPADAAVAVFVRESRFVGRARTMFVYADEQLVGTLDDGTWTAAVLPPGERTLWLNWAKVTHRATLEAGKVHFFNIPMSGFVEVDEATGRALIAAVGQYATVTAKERETAREHVRERYGKAQAAAASAPQARPATGRGERERHVAQWPLADLSPYAVLYVENFPVTDPKAAERTQEHLVETAPGRLASMLVQNLPRDLFAEVRRGAPEEGAPGAVVLRGEITQYKPGSAAARFMIAGAGAARLDFAVRLVDAASGAELARFGDQRSYGWGGVMGAAGGIESIEQNLAYELALYLQRCKGATDAPAAPGGRRAELAEDGEVQP
jgi:hypothetical protein